MYGMRILEFLVDCAESLLRTLHFAQGDRVGKPARRKNCDEYGASVGGDS
jgi:hypothetical protein